MDKKLIDDLRARLRQANRDIEGMLLSGYTGKEGESKLNEAIRERWYIEEELLHAATEKGEAGASVVIGIAISLN